MNGGSQVDFLLTYDAYMSQEKMQEICPSAKLILKCVLTDCQLVFRRFYETAALTLEQGEYKVPAILWQLSKEELQDMKIVYPKELYHQIDICLKMKDENITANIFVMKETPIAYPNEKELDLIEEAYGEHNFDYSCVENALDMAKDMEGENGTLYE